MDNKLQELTDKLYSEGLSKGKAEGEQILADAKKQAEAILAKARKQAEDILAKAGKDAEDLKSRTESDVKMASGQAMQALRQQIENMIVAKAAEEGTSKALSSADFVKEIITAVAKNFSSENPEDLSLVLPESQKAELEPFVKDQLSKIIGKGVTATFSKNVGEGFTIGPKDGSYFISMTDETFKALISGYLRPAAKKLLFGE